MFPYYTIHTLNAVVEWLALLLHIQEITGSNIVQTLAILIEVSCGTEARKVFQIRP
jgi:hypothetical protein